MVEQPIHRALAAPSQAGIDLSSLLGNVDVHRGRGVDGVQTGQGFAQAVGRHGAQRVRRQPQASTLRFAQRLELLQQGQHVVGRADEPALANAGRRAAKAAGLVEHGQQGQADACAGSGSQQAHRQSGIVGIRMPLWVVVHVMEFAHAGVTGFQHLDIQARGNGFELFGCDGRRKLVHQAAPAPEAVLLSPPVFGQACKRPLKRVRMQIGHARHHGACCAWDAFRATRLRPHIREHTLVIPRQQHITRPARGQQGVFGKQAAAVHAARLCTPMPSTAKRPWRTTLQAGRWPSQ